MKVDHTINNKCSGCGDCCANILPISDKEVGRIKQYIKKNNIEPVNRNNVLTGEYVDICPFLNKENRCNIYEIRPDVCRNFLCSKMLNYTGELVNHKNKGIINILKTFYPKSYCPDTPDFDIIKDMYDNYKEKIYGK